MEDIILSVEALMALGAVAVLGSLLVLVAFKTRFRFSREERGLINFILKEAEKQKVEKGDLPGFLFENFDSLRITYIKSLTGKVEINKILYACNVLDLRSEILNSYAK